jgi:transposase
MVMKIHPTSSDMEECMKLLEWKGQSVPLLPPPPGMVGEETMITQDVFRRIKELKAQGWGTRRIAKKLGLDRNTIKSYLGQEEFVPYSRQGTKHPSLAELEDWLRERTPEVQFNARVLFQESQIKGFSGGYETIKRFVRPLRDAMN